jgi:molybdopterin-containing oxidoreductase family iron-sulfur binding subunit
MTHAWESRSDARAYEGVATIPQPRALPLYDGIDIQTMLALFAESTPASPLEIVQTTWKSRMMKDFAGTWREASAHGVISDTTSPKVDARLRGEATRLTPPEPPRHPLTILFCPDPCIWDGRDANNPWLQELPRPLTKLTWDNPLCIP